MANASDPGARPDLTDLDGAHQTYLARVMSMPEESFGGPSLLPGWTRAHVIAHVANHGLGVRRAVDAFQAGREVALYDSTEARDADIARIAARSPAQLRELSEYAIREVTGAVSTIRPEQAAESVPRVPGGPRFPLGEMVSFRTREVLIHLADLDIGYTPGGWPTEFADYLLAAAADDRGAEPIPGGLLVGGSEVRGDPAALAWWLIGRGAGEGLSGDLPELGSWR